MVPAPLMTQEQVSADLEELLANLSSRVLADQLEACARLTALATSGIARAHAERFRRAGGTARLTALLRSADADVVDAATEALARLSSAAHAHGRPPRSYLFDGGAGGAHVEVLIKEMDHSSAGTGYGVWTSALLLCKWLCSPAGLARSRVRERAVLELGAGCGAVGLVAAKLGAPSVVLSDNQPEVLRTLRAALALNGVESGRARVACVDWAVEAGDDAHVPELDPIVPRQAEPAGAQGATSDGCTGGGGGGMEGSEGERDEAAEEGLGAGERFDLILGSDVVYEPSHPRLIAAIVARRLAARGLLVLVMTVRSLRTHAALLDALENEPAIGAVSVERLESEWGELALPDLVETGTTMHASHYPGGISLICAQAAPR